jgi:hypothetical protein
MIQAAARVPSCGRRSRDWIAREQDPEDWQAAFQMDYAQAQN